jgi:signal transduction histidine kinase
MLASIGFTIPHLGYFFVGHILAFTICILLFGDQSASTDRWVLSNVIGIFGMAGIGYAGENFSLMTAVGAFLTIVSGGFKALAFIDGRIMRKRYKWGHIFSVLALMCAVAIIAFPNLPYRRLVFLVGLVLVMIASLMYLKTSRQWRGLKQADYVSAVMFFGILASFLVIGRTALLEPYHKLVDYSAAGTSNFFQLCVASMAFQVVFLVLIFGLNRRQLERAARRSARLENSFVLKKMLLEETRALSDERQNLIKMLTHEVRQPLNTAQAALLSIATDVRILDLTGSSVGPKLSNALTVLNDITVSISNSLLGATLISNDRRAELKSVGICDIAQLAYLDVDLSNQARIDMQFDQAHFYADADPIVLRLALRNLLENAVKYSPADTPIVFKVEANEDRLSIRFSITNRVIDLAMLDGDIFARNKRGADSRYGGDGLGLFIVNEVAKMHKGTLHFDIAGNDVTFVLEIPA